MAPSCSSRARFRRSSSWTRNILRESSLHFFFRAFAFGDFSPQGLVARLQFRSSFPDPELESVTRLPQFIFSAHFVCHIAANYGENSLAADLQF